MVKLYDQATGELLGTVSDGQFQFLVDQLEEESLEDRDYAITPMTIAYFESQGADPDLIALLRRALGSREEVIVRWSRT
jgi:processive 1,2-diacylglycerol beta-glucosyltransferase